jgi:RNA polymerase subunit RPABC4/transcription elongation factor Spt4
LPSYKQSCIYCNKLISADSNACPYCGKRNPIILRCPKCKNPISKEEKYCSYCNLCLETTCPECGKVTFFGDYCDNCQGALTIICPNPKCRLEQPLLSDKCIKCGKKLRK